MEPLIHNNPRLPNPTPTLLPLIIPDILIIELQWVVLSKRHPEISKEIFAETMEAIKTDPTVRLEAVTPEVANEQRRLCEKPSFFDAYYAAFSIIHKKKLLTTNRKFKPYEFAAVL